MDMKQALGAASVVFALLQYLPYIRDVVKNKTKPHAFSWFVWSVPSGVIFAAQVVEDGGAGSWATGVSTLLCTIIFILSFWRGEKHITRLDQVALALGVGAIGLWVVTKNPLDSVLLSTFADVIGFVPTLRKSMTKPEEETASTYMVSVVKWGLSLFAMTDMSLVNLVYPVAMMAANSGTVVFLYIRKRIITV